MPRKQRDNHLSYFGILPVNKPIGISSRKAADCVKKVVRPAKVGHTGTLDPLASGVLVMCIGPATRLADIVQKMPKTYVGEFRLGLTSESEDIESELRPVDSAPLISEDEMRSALQAFVGTISQVPPAFSALKVDGRRAYKLARQGVAVELEPREVKIHSLELLQFAYPDFKLKIECGSGTYVRSLGRDIGESLDSGAVMTALLRSAVGPFDVERSVPLDQLESCELRDSIIEPGELFFDSAKVRLDESQIQLLKNGHMFLRDEFQIPLEADKVAAFDNNDQLLAVLCPHRDGRLKPRLNFVHHYDFD